MLSVSCKQCGSALTRLQKGNPKQFCNSKCRYEFIRPAKARRNGKREAKATHPCEVCGKLSAPRYRQARYFCSWGCYCKSRAPIERVCENCGKPFTRIRKPNRAQGDALRCCSRECGWALGRTASVVVDGVKLRKQQQVCAIFPKPCSLCGEPFAARRSNQAACDSCLPEFRRRQSVKHTQERMARLRLGTNDVSIDYDSLLAKTGGRCHICGMRCLASIHGWHPLAMTIEHLFPVKWHGRNDPGNLSIAHRLCNTMKSDSLTVSEDLKIRAMEAVVKSMVDWAWLYGAGFDAAVGVAN